MAGADRPYAFGLLWNSWTAVRAAVVRAAGLGFANMFKLLFTLVVNLLLGLALLGLRHHRLEIFNQTAKLHEQIKLREDTLRDQQVLIASRTNPLAVAEGLRTNGQDLFGGGPAGVATRPAARPTGHDPDRDLVPPGGRRSRPR